MSTSSPDAGSLNGSRWVWTVRHSVHLSEDRGLDLLRDVVRLVEREVARQLEVERDLDAPVDVENHEVVDLAHVRDRERRREHTLADRHRRPARLDVDDDVDPRQGVVQGALDAVGRGVALADGGAGGDADDDVREVLAARSAEAEPTQLHGWIEPRDRMACDPASLLGRPVHEHVDVPAREPYGGGDDEPGHEQRCDRVPGGDVERRRDEAGENGDRPCEVAPEVERVGEQRVAAVEPGAAERDHRPRRVDREHERDRRERPPGRVDVELDDTGQAQDRR